MNLLTGIVILHVFSQIKKMITKISISSLDQFVTCQSHTWHTSQIVWLTQFGHAQFMRYCAIACTCTNCANHKKKIWKKFMISKHARAAFKILENTFYFFLLDRIAKNAYHLSFFECFFYNRIVQNSDSPLPLLILILFTIKYHKKHTLPLSINGFFFTIQ